MEYRIKEYAGVFTIEVSKEVCKTERGFSITWVNADADGKPMRSFTGITYGQCRCITFTSLDTAREVARDWKAEDEKLKEVIYHEI